MSLRFVEVFDLVVCTADELRPRLLSIWASIVPPGGHIALFVEAPALVAMELETLLRDRLPSEILVTVSNEAGAGPWLPARGPTIVDVL